MGYTKVSNLAHGIVSTAAKLFAANYKDYHESIIDKRCQRVGKAGEIKEVADGYGKNFLIGKGLSTGGYP
jgi:hypothetical protein